MRSICYGEIWRSSKEYSTSILWSLVVSEVTLLNCHIGCTCLINSTSILTLTTNKLNIHYLNIWIHNEMNEGSLSWLLIFSWIWVRKYGIDNRYIWKSNKDILWKEFCLIVGKFTVFYNHIVYIHQLDGIWLCLVACKCWWYYLHRNILRWIVSIYYRRLISIVIIEYRAL